ncbi:uncharacterized protein LOC115763004 [Drosophila novamexicana]|uniref:uncharacterized protein LOC115763004 n=1 Tax=Drosophila novamexicana TaxID=47314 RepID=UPI0011E5996D|nr:uncharacterized protein LOC115763004 [Drosophila novamexicana]
METLSISIVAFLQLLGYSYFIKQPEDQCSPSPPFGSWVFLLATLCFLWDLKIYPCRFMHMARHWQLLVEIVGGLFLTEIATLIVWCGVERVIFWLTQELIHLLELDDCLHGLHEYSLHGLTPVAVSGALLWFIIEATDTKYCLVNSVRKMKRNWQQMLRMLRIVCRMNNTDRRRTLRACKLAMFPPRRGRCKQEEEDDGEDQEGLGLDDEAEDTD